jgi:transposase
MSQEQRIVIGGVDTHKDVHVAAVIDDVGKILDTSRFETTSAGYSKLLAWLRTYGELRRVGVEGTGSYGAGLAHYLATEGIEVIEVKRPNRQLRRRRGKSDPVDAEAAARAVLNGEATTVPKSGQSLVESIRVLRVAFTSARHSRTRVILQIRDLLVTAPDQLRGVLDPLSTTERVARCSRFRVRGDLADPAEASRLALRTLARRYLALSEEMDELKLSLADLTARANPALRAVKGVGPDVAAILLVAAGDNPERLRNEASFAAMCGVSPVQASSGQTTRHRLNRSGNRQANHALWRIATARLITDAETRAYAERHTSEGKSRREIVRCRKRYIAREVFRTLTRPEAIPRGADLHDARTAAGFNLKQVAAVLRVDPTRVSRLERALDFDRDLADRYSAWLTAQNAA